MKHFHDDFSALLNGFKLETLENDPNSIYGLSVGLALNYLNAGWFDFAKENQGEPAISERFVLGTYIGDAMSGSVRDYYLEAFQNVLQTGKVWHHDYECSSPEKFRIYHQSVYPLYNRQGLIIVNSLVKEHPLETDSRTPCQPIRNLYTQETGFITQCSNCRRVQLATRQDVWDWVPAWVEQMPENTSHGLCQICFEYYYEFKYPQKK
ncbi:MAG: hypothetical protein H7Y05_08580 [Steroidobacteraceae bacterium]|nr:hypothetical protein [Deltaproteobacteria bacterium]